MKHFSKVSILVCTHVHTGLQNPSCGSSLTIDLIEKLKQRIIDLELDISVREQACFGRCEEAVVARIYPKKHFVTQLTELTLPELIDMAKQSIDKE